MGTRLITVAAMTCPLPASIFMTSMTAAAAETRGQRPVASPSMLGGAKMASPDYNVDKQTIERLMLAKPNRALDEIVRLARHTQIVILNEDHRRPHHRKFGLEVARALRPLGYNVLALETLVNVENDAKAADMMRALERRGHLVSTDGMYTNEPAFAAFVQAALRIDYRLVSYESTSLPLADVEADIAQREQEQADNLVRRVKVSRGEKVLVYVGLSHVAERDILSTSGQKRHWFAARVKEISGIDPLTIDQATLDSDPVFQPSRPLYPVACRARVKEPFVLISRGKLLVVGPYRRAVDLQIVHPLGSCG